MRKVEVYRLWPDGMWDKVEIEVPAEPWIDTIVETRAVEKAWLNLVHSENKPFQIGLLMHTFFDVQ